MNSIAMRLLYCMLFVFQIGFAESNKILVISPSSQNFIEAIEAMKSNLSEIDIVQVEVSTNNDLSFLSTKIRENNPKLVVLMDNKGIRDWKSYLKLNPDNTLPVVALMALQIEASLKDLPHSIGISYELPAVTTVSRLRGLLQVPVVKVGVVYRSSMEPFFLLNKKFAQSEKINLIGEKIEDQEDLESGISKALQKVMTREKVDALWVINDNQLLTAKTILNVWIPTIKKTPMPVIVGVESLIQTKLSFGMFAALPDPKGLGAQAANVIYEIQDNAWKISDNRVDQPLSIIQILNTSVAGQMTKLKNDAPKLVDKVLE